MKKTVKSLFVLMIMAILLVGMTGCGDDEKSKKDKDEANESNNGTLVATKSGEDDFYGKYDERIEVTFKDGKAEKIVMTRELENENTAKSIEKVISYLNTEEGMKFEVEGKKIIITFDAKTYIAEQGIKDGDLSRDSFKKVLEEAGYTVK